MSDEQAPLRFEADPTIPRRTFLGGILALPSLPFLGGPRPGPTDRPTPIDLMVNYIAADSGEVMTTIFREWAPGDSGPGGRCQGCFKCIATAKGRCQMSVDNVIPVSEAADFSPRDLGLHIVEEGGLS